jgi:hypothetical protein
MNIRRRDKNFALAKPHAQKADMAEYVKRSLMAQRSRLYSPELAFLYS